MPVEIKELVIRAVVDPAPNAPRTGHGKEQDSALERQELIQACVKEVLRVLKNSEER